MAVTGSIAAGVVVGTSFMQQEEQKKANKAQRKAQRTANQIELRKAGIENQRNRRQAVEQARVLSAANTAAAAGSGMDYSSSVLGINTNTYTKLQEAIGYQNTLLAANSMVSSTLQKGSDKAARHVNSANQWGAVAGLSSQVASIAIPS